MRTITLTEIFSDAQLKQIVELYNQLGDTPALHKQLLNMFKAITPPLEDKGMLPEYAAYLVPYALSQHMKTQVGKKARSKLVQIARAEARRHCF